jgi:DNA helicase HerA-like ATPase
MNVVAGPGVPEHAELSERQHSVRAGRVVSTAGSQIIILLDDDMAGHAGIHMGSLVTVRGPHGLVFGIVEGLSTPMPLRDDDRRELKMAEIGLLGEVPDLPDGTIGNFRRGVTRLPSLDASVFMAEQQDAALVYALPNRRSVCIGTAHQDPRVPARISVDDMLCKHFAILGTTGSGKSCAVTVLLKRILECHPNGHILLLDPHGEYGAAFPEQAEHLSIDTFRLPYWLFNFEEFTELIFGHERHEASAEIMHLRDLVVAAKRCFAGEGRSASWITADSPVPYTMGDLSRLLEEAIGRLDSRSNLPEYLRIKARIGSVKADRRYDFLFDIGLGVRDNLGAILGRLFRVPAAGKPLAILDLSSLPFEVLNVVVAIVARLAFDFAVCAGQLLPLLLVCEEAHRYAPQDAAPEFEPAKRALSRIAKEGRKYGISLGVISQRPSELASTILSQCNTVFAFRMSNERDQEIIDATLTEASPALFAALPFLGNSEAIAIGEGVPVPMRLRFSDLPDNERPRSASASFSDRWQAAGEDTTGQLDRLVRALRGDANG